MSKHEPAPACTRIPAASLVSMDAIATLIGVTEVGQPSEEALVAAAANGDREALATLVERAAPQARAACGREIPRRWQAMLSADDVLQEAVTDVLVALRGFRWRGPGSFAAWFATIARNNLLNAIRLLEADKRGGGRQPMVGHGRIDHSSYDSLLATVAGDGLTPSGETARLERHRLLASAIERLPPVHRQAIQLFDLEGGSAAATAEAIGRSVGAMHMVRARAHRMLKEHLDASECRA